MLLQTNSYIVPKDKRSEHSRLIRRFRQTLGRLGTIEAQLEASGVRADRRVLDFGFVRAPDRVAGLLGLEEGSTVLRVRRLSGAGNSPVLSAVAYLAAAAVLVVPTIALAVPWLTELHRLVTS